MIKKIEIESINVTLAYSGIKCTLTVHNSIELNIINLFNFQLFKNFGQGNKATILYNTEKKHFFCLKTH